jgi:hypothetical protein
MRKARDPVAGPCLPSSLRTEEEIMDRDDQPTPIDDLPAKPSQAEGDVGDDELTDDETELE